MRKKYRVNSGKSSKLWTILSQATKALVEGAETSWGVTNLTHNTTLAPDNFIADNKVDDIVHAYSIVKNRRS